MTDGSQGELFGRSQFGVSVCARCGSVGTIVDMGRCCLIQRLLILDSASGLAQEAVLATNEPTSTNERRRSVA